MILDNNELNVPDLSECQVVVLMGGIGSRLEEVTKSVPKPMIKICDIPFFLYEFKLLALAGFKKFLFLVGYKSNQIQDYFGDGSSFGVEINYSYDGQEQLGTAGAIIKAYDKLENSFLLIYGDTLLDIDYFEVIYRFFVGKAEGKTALMTIFRNNGNFDTSNVVFNNGEIIEYNKNVIKNEMHFIDYGISMFDKDIFKLLPRGKKLDLSLIQTRLVLEKRMTACVVRKRFYEIGTPDSLASFKEYAMKRYYTKQKAVFVDRDGVINEIVFNDDTEQLDSPLKKGDFKFIENAIDGLKLLNEKGYLLFIITNQPAAAKGKVKLSVIYDINGYMLDQLKSEGVSIEGVQICPHHPDLANKTQERFLIRHCLCRKPGTKMIGDILCKYCIDLANSYMIGDSFTDVLAGRRAGLKTAFIGDFKCDVCHRLNELKPDLIGNNLYDIAKLL